MAGHRKAIAGRRQPRDAIAAGGAEDRPQAGRWSQGGKYLNSTPRPTGSAGCAIARSLRWAQRRSPSQRLPHPSGDGKRATCRRASERVIKSGARRRETRSVTARGGPARRADPGAPSAGHYDVPHANLPRSDSARPRCVNNDKGSTCRPIRRPDGCSRSSSGPYWVTTRTRSFRPWLWLGTSRRARGPSPSWHLFLTRFDAAIPSSISARILACMLITFSARSAGAEQSTASSRSRSPPRRSGSSRTCSGSQVPSLPRKGVVKKLGRPPSRFQ